MHRESKAGDCPALIFEDVTLRKAWPFKKGDMSLDQNQLHYGISLKLYFERKVFGPGILVLLRGVESTGSLRGATQATSMAYNKAWKMLKESEKVWGFMLTEREVGGRDGGGSTLMPQTARLLEAYDAFMAEIRQELDRLLGQYFSQEWVGESKQLAEQADE